MMNSKTQYVFIKTFNDTAKAFTGNGSFDGYWFDYSAANDVVVSVADGKVTAKAKEDAKAKADEYLKMWQDGAKTEESFIELVKKYSEDSSATTGGLFENITPVSNYVDNFLNWSIAETRKVGDTEVIESEYGYHVMYYVGASELNYRDMMISDDLRAADLQAWYEGIIGDAKAELVNDKFVKTDLILAPAK
jgi:parvulin-like peptidyl-prolyl isomerase